VGKGDLSKNLELHIATVMLLRIQIIPAQVT